VPALACTPPLIVRVESCSIPRPPPRCYTFLHRVAGSRMMRDRPPMDMTTINSISFVSCLVGLAVGVWLLRWSRRELATLSGERHYLMKRRLGHLGRRAHAGAFLLGAIVILSISVLALFDLLLRH